jgi:hypothetical protein
VTTPLLKVKISGHQELGMPHSLINVCTIHEASNLNNADVACNADQGQFSSYEHSARSKIPALRNYDFLWFQNKVLLYAANLTYIVH